MELFLKLWLVPVHGLLILSEHSLFLSLMNTSKIRATQPGWWRWKRACEPVIPDTIGSTHDPGTRRPTKNNGHGGDKRHVEINAHEHGPFYPRYRHQYRWMKDNSILSTITSLWHDWDDLAWRWTWWWLTSRRDTHDRSQIWGRTIVVEVLCQWVTVTPWLSASDIHIQAGANFCHRTVFFSLFCYCRAEAKCQTWIIVLLTSSPSAILCLF